MKQQRCSPHSSQEEVHGCGSRTLLLTPVSDKGKTPSTDCIWWGDCIEDDPRPEMNFVGVHCLKLKFLFLNIKTYFLLIEINANVLQPRTLPLCWQWELTRCDKYDWTTGQLNWHICLCHAIGHNILDILPLKIEGFYVGWRPLSMYALALRFS